MGAENGGREKEKKGERYKRFKDAMLIDLKMKGRTTRLGV